MDSLLIPTLGSGGFKHVIHETFWPAHIKMCAWERFSKNFGRVEPLLGWTVLEMKGNGIGKCRLLDPLQECRSFHRSRAVMHLEAGLRGRETLSHTKDRSYTNPSCEK